MRTALPEEPASFGPPLLSLLSFALWSPGAALAQSLLSEGFTDGIDLVQCVMFFQKQIESVQSVLFSKFGLSWINSTRF